jgi:hypothetical protein
MVKSSFGIGSRIELGALLRKYQLVPLDAPSKSAYFLCVLVIP